MNNALWVSKTGMAAQDAKMAAISNNLANVNTIGYKRDRVVFEDLFYEIKRQPGAPTDQNSELPTGVQIGSGVRVVGTQKIFSQGNVQNTGQSLDVAIMGQGMFQIENGDGDLSFTRNGQFHVSSDGLIVNTEGFPVVPNIEVPPNTTSLTIGADGMVSVTLNGVAESQELGQIVLAQFRNPAGLQAMGGNLFQQTDASGDPLELLPTTEGAGALKQGALEGSNVQVVEEMVEMITTQRAYEMNAKVVSAADEMMKYIAQSV